MVISVSFVGGLKRHRKLYTRIWVNYIVEEASKLGEIENERGRSVIICSFVEANIEAVS